MNTEVTDEHAIDRGPLRWTDVPGYLLGVRSSIDRVIASKHSVWLSAALVATAALAREYDAVSIVHQPWDLLAPFAASILISAIVYVVVKICLSIAKVTSPDNAWEDYKVFLTGYWMTAPLAWLYAIPIETMTDELSALRFNLTMLSIVSLWRVLLFARFVSVRYSVSFLAALSWVLVPCMAVALVALFQSVMSMVGIMGGLRLTETQQVLMTYQSNLFAILFYGVVPTLLIAVGMAYAIRVRRKGIHVIRSIPSDMNRSVWAIPVLAFFVLGSAAARFQPDQFRSAQVDRMLLGGRSGDAVAYMQQRGESSFPVVWDPPPKFPQRDSQTPRISDLLDAIEVANPDRWVIDRLLVQADEILMRQFDWYQGVGNESYLEHSLFLLETDKLIEMQEQLQKLAAMPANENDRQRRKRLVEISAKAIEASKKNDDSLLSLESEEAK